MVAVAGVAMSLAMVGLVACTSTTGGVGRGSTSTKGVSQHPVVAFLGDSYTRGTGASTPGHRWSTLVAHHFGWIENNFALGGTGYTPSIYRPNLVPYRDRVADVAAVNPSIVVVSGGVNDLFHGITNAQFRQAAYATFASLRRALPHSRLVAIRPFYPSSFPPARLAVFAGEIRLAVIAVGGTYLDIGSPLTNTPADLGPIRGHPNDTGYQLLAEAVERAFSTQR